MTTLNLFTNRATAKLAADVSSADTALTLVPGGGDWFPAPGAGQFFRLVLQKGTSQTDQREYMVCTSRAGDVLTVTRAQEGTPAANFTAGDEVSLVATALTMTSMVQRVGATLQGALEVEADPTTPLGIATKAFVEAGRVNDVPDDGLTYGRMFGAWMALGAAAGLAVPIPVAAGGTGGTTVAQAQTNLYIPTTTFDDLEPATKKYGDRWIKPSNMTELVWAPNAGGGGAGIWINPADAASQAYPIAIDHGGTGATTAAQARINLGIGGTIPFVLADGTVAAPGLAWASEPGLGWTRFGAQSIGVVASGNYVKTVDASNAAATQFYLFPRAAGVAQINLSNQPTGAPNVNLLAINATQAGYNIVETLSGAATAKPLNITFPGDVFINSRATIKTTAAGVNASLTLDKTLADRASDVIGAFNGVRHWMLRLGNGPGGNPFSILRCDDAGAVAGESMNIDRASGLINFYSPAVQLSAPVVGVSPFIVITKPADAQSSSLRGTTAGRTNWELHLGSTLGSQGGNFEVARFNAAGAYVGSPFFIDKVTGAVTVVGANNPLFLVSDPGTAIGANFRLQAAGGNKTLRMNNNTLEIINNAYSAVLAEINDAGRLGMLYGYATKANAGSSLGANAFNIWHDSGQFLFIDQTNCGKFAYDPSDERIKKDIKALCLHEDAFMALRPIEYSHRDLRGIWKDDGVRHWGWSAQQVKSALPIAAYGNETPLPKSDTESWAPMAVSDRPILALTVLHVQDLINRVTQLEKA